MASICLISLVDIGINHAGMAVVIFICPVQHLEQEKNVAPMAAFHPPVMNLMKN